MATKIVYTPYWSQRLDDIVDDRVVDYVAGEVRNDASQNAPHGITHRLAASFVTFKPRNLVRWIGSTVFYWRFVERGTSPHTIEGDPALAWPPHWLVRRRVRHPGATQNPHLKPALYKKRALPRF